MSTPHVKAGDRVVLQIGEDWLHARVHAASEETALVTIVGAAGWYHRAPTADLWKVCGVCPDCRALNDRPGCMQ